MEINKDNDEQEMLVVETKSVLVETQAGRMVTLWNNRTGKTKTLRVTGTVEEAKSERGLDRTWIQR